jgi:serine O-acetyltransferase
MIKSKNEYHFYLEADKIALQIVNNWKNFLFYDTWRFEKLLRKYEYYLNCKKSKIWLPYIYYLKYKHYRIGKKLGFTIPPNVFGPGLSIPHFGTIIVNSAVKVGENCRIHNCVHLATQCGETKCPTIGNNVFIGPGVVIIGDIFIADDIIIGANSFVNKSFYEKGITIAGSPAKKVSDKGFETCYFKATEILKMKKKYK